jgi:serine/threonine protein phosphatase 1
LPSYIVGDIHGRSDLLGSLLPKLETAEGDNVVFLGDYIDRGPDSKGVVDSLLHFADTTRATVTFILGNHEQWMRRSLDDPCRHSWVLGMQGLDTVKSYSLEAARIIEDEMNFVGADLFLQKLPLPYDALVSSMPPDHLRFFEELLPYARTQDVVCVHAGVSGEYVTVESETEQTLVWGQNDWWQKYRGKDTIVYGHWNNANRSSGLAEPFACNGTFGIDCVASNELIAVRFPDLSIWRSD